jgi:HrpA-like RNA helicase
MRRVPLVDVCLLVKSLGIEDISAFLAAAPDPPEPAAVVKAVRELQALGALTEQQELTSLGKLLALLPGELLFQEVQLLNLHPAGYV